MFCNGKRDIHNQIVLYIFYSSDQSLFIHKGPSAGAKGTCLLSGGAMGLVGQMPHYATVLKNALLYHERNATSHAASHGCFKMPYKLSV